MWWVNQLTRVFTHAVSLEGQGNVLKYGNITNNNRKCVTLQTILCPIWTFLAPASPSLSHPILLCQLCCPQLTHPYILWFAILLASGLSSLPASILVLWLRFHLLTFSLLFDLPQTLGFSILPLPYHSPIWGSPASPSLITPTILINVSLHLSLPFPHSPSQPLCLLHYILRRPQMHISLCGCWKCVPSSLLHIINFPF